MIGTSVTADSDAAFFADHPDRSFRLRAVAFPEEFLFEFRSLGPHREDRRRVLVHRLSRAMRRRYGADLVPIPFLLFSDETVEDTDAVLGPIFRGIMNAAGARSLT